MRQSESECTNKRGEEKEGKREKNCENFRENKRIKTEKDENTKQPFLIIRSTGEEDFSQKLNNIYERYTNIEVDYKPVLSKSGNIIYTALVKVLDNSKNSEFLVVL